MKIFNVLCCITITTFTIACSSCQHPKDDLPCIDIRKNYPTKEIILTDIADITYLHLNSDNPDYLYSGSICAITANTIVINDPMSGDILFFDKNGQPKSRFNRKGNGPGEYHMSMQVLYDENSDDVFIRLFNSTSIKIYSSEGKFKREITLPSGTRMGNDLISFDDISLLFYDTSKESERIDVDYGKLPVGNLISPFYRISKADGAVLDYIALPVAPIFLGIYLNGRAISGFKIRLIKCAEGALLCNPENDMVYLYGKDQSLTPILHKIPMADATNPMTYFNNCINLGNYQFTEVFTVRAGDPYPGLFPVKYYVRNKKTGEVSQQKLLLSDYQGKEFIISPAQSRTRVFDNNGYYFELDLLELKQAYSQNKLSGQLKELVSMLKEEDNNVYVMVNFK